MIEKVGNDKKTIKELINWLFDQSMMKNIFQHWSIDEGYACRK